MQKIGDRTQYSLVYNNIETFIPCPAGWEGDAVKVERDKLQDGVQGSLDTCIACEG